MTEWILTSSLLIVLILGLRLVLKGRIGLRLQYALWALVLVRLLVPFQFATSSISALTFAEKLTPTPVTSVSTPAVTTPVTQPNTPVTPEPVVPGLTVIPETPVTSEAPEKTGWEYPFTLKQTLTFVWLLGMSLLALSMIISNLRFGLRLRRSRQAAPAYRKHRVFYSPVVDSPCLFGLFRPCIYLPESCQKDDEALSHVLAHEHAHYGHADHIWSVLRCLCLCLHWYNPLVWVAAFLSKADSELACDEAAIQALGEEHRTQYGKTLIRLSCAKPGAKNLLSTATTMDGSKRTLKNRILLIAKHPKTKWITLIVLILAAAVICLVVFTGPKNDPGAETEPPETEPIIDIFDPPVYNDGGIEGVFLFSGSKLYVWDYSAAEPSLGPGYAKPDGVVLTNDIHTVPYLDAYACRLEEGTEIYHDTVYDRIYTKPGPIGSGLEKATFVPVMDMTQWWQETPITSGYYSLIGNAHLRDKYYIYLNGNGGGAYICGNFETPMAVGKHSLQISRKYSLNYRLDGIVLTTSTGTYLYYGQEKPEIPASDTLTAGTYRILGEIGSELDHMNSPYLMRINADGTGTLNYLDKTYSLTVSEDTLSVDGAAAYYSYSHAQGRGALVMQVDGEKTILYMNGETLYSTSADIDTSLSARGTYNGYFAASGTTTDLSRTLSCVHNGKDIDLRRLFYNGIEGNREPNEEELQYLISQGFDPKFGITRITTEQIDHHLSAYLGLRMSECDLVGIKDFVYYNGAYFFNHSSKERITISVLGVIHGDDCDTILYQYTDGCMPQYEGLLMEAMLEFDEYGGIIVRYNRISNYAIE